MKCCDYDLWCIKFVYPFRGTLWSKWEFKKVHFHSKFVQYVWWVELRQKIGPVWAHNASQLNFIYYCLCKMTYISIRFCKNIQQYSTVENKYFVRLQISISFWSCTILLQRKMKYCSSSILKLLNLLDFKTWQQQETSYNSSKLGGLARKS